MLHDKSKGNTLKCCFYILILAMIMLLWRKYPFASLVFLLLCVVFSLLPFRTQHKDPFEQLTVKERLGVLRQILKREMRHLEIALPLRLVPSERLPVEVLGSYHPGTGVIEINKDLLIKKHPDSVELLEVITHEVQHVLQLQSLLQLDYQMFSSMSQDHQLQAMRLSKEFLNYKSGYEDGYAEQIIERQARAYAQERTEYYRMRLPEIVAAYLKHQAKRRDTDSERK